ncbi:alpha/beta fold hydrolase [Blastococcus sp. TML/M2B]|uniref:alpha/beta hydrolase n=1 Tax=unclassified Blastococcus TaxID=2619396 RepID=UPI00190CB805|nr:MULTISPECIES: alpha/beta hydrolase [unclassified Blastococcus]MBN1093143.1 alpha/beta fold hydrolase [Blastococcus sp. TML/M2B]MBN1096737.1 alpha/beta fold hydrolase [Blastococcus sp. TML/C7B]
MPLHHGRRAVLPSLLAALTLLAAGCTSDGGSDEEATTSASSAPAEPTAEPIEWTDCNDLLQPLLAGRPGSERGMTFECGQVTVPISYDEPGGERLPLRLVRGVHPQQTEKIGSLVVNPGGPGASGLDAALGLALTLPEDVLRRFDLVGFDPRGVASSSPVECIPDATKDRIVAAEPQPTSAEQLDSVFDLAREVAEGCAERYESPAALGAFNTVDTARDMDLIRQSLGEEQLTYLGYSYGTTLGSTYAELFPDRVRAFVLDAAVDPDADLRAAGEARAAGLEAGFDAFAQNCTGLIAGCPLGADPRVFVDELMLQASQAPIASTKEGETRQATPGVVLTAIQAGLYDTRTWPQLSQSLAAARAGDAAGLFSLADSYSGRLQDGRYSNLLDANLAINCADTEEEVDTDEVRALAAEWDAEYPLFGANAAAGLYNCTPWEADRTPLPTVDAEGSAPILVVGNQGDPVTPLPGAVNLAEDLTAGVLLTWQGQGHTAYPKNQCVNDAVNAYLIDLVVPVDGLTCPA